MPLNLSSVSIEFILKLLRQYAGQSPSAQMIKKTLPF